MVKTTGAVENDYLYDAFGNQVDEVSNQPFEWRVDEPPAPEADYNPFRYTGEYFDYETGYIYLRARYYDSSNGRFVSEDPIRSGNNWYSYCAGNPVTFIDPRGLATVNLVDYMNAMGANVLEFEVDGVKKATVTINGKRVTYTLNSGLIDDTVLNEKFGLPSFLTDADRKAEVGIAVIDGKLYKDFTIPINKALKIAEGYAKIHYLDLIWFYLEVTHGGTWDIKLKENWNETIAADTFPGQNTKIVVNGEITTPHELGNITYGYIGAACGFSLTTLLSGGDFAAGSYSGGVIGGVLGVFKLSDSLEDKKEIYKGYMWYNNRKKK